MVSIVGGIGREIRPVAGYREQRSHHRPIAMQPARRRPMITLDVSGRTVGYLPPRLRIVIQKGVR